MVAIVRLGARASQCPNWWRFKRATTSALKPVRTGSNSQR